MNIKFHPDKSTIVSFAAGSLSANFSAIVAAHVQMCPVCQLEVLAAERVGAVLMSQKAVGDDSNQVTSFDQMWQKITQAPTKQASVVAQKDCQQLLSDFSAGKSWKKVCPGISQIKVLEGSSGVLRLLKIEPGMTMPLHTHHGNEMTLILSGSYSDELGRFQAGDIADVDDDTEHQPIADENEPCICLIATQAPLKFKAILPKLFQPFIGL